MRLGFELLEDRRLLSGVAQWTNHDAGGQGAFFTPSFSPFNPNELYFASDMTGLFHSTDQGSSWTRADFRQIVTGAYGDSVQFTSDPLIRYAIDFSKVNGGYTAARPTKSTDGGANWSPLANWTTPVDLGLAQFLYADPHSTTNLLVSTQTKLYFSGDGGLSFSLVYTDATGLGCAVAGVFFDSPNVYVATNAGLLVSTTGGSSFTLSPINVPAGEAMYSFAGAKDPSSGALRFFTVTLTSSAVVPNTHPSAVASNYKGIYSIAWGTDAAWTKTVTGLPTSYPYAYLTSVAMAQNDPSTAYIAGRMSAAKPVVYKTTDAGASWQKVFFPIGNVNIATGWLGDNGFWAWEWGSHVNAIAVYPTNSSLIAIADQGSEHISTDGAANWNAVYVTPADRNQENAPIDKRKAYHTSGLSDPTTWGVTWADPLTMFGSFTDVLGERSTDGGASWSFDYTGMYTGSALDSPNETYQVINGLQQPGVLYAANSNSRGQLYFSSGLTDATIDGELGRVTWSLDGGHTWAVLHDFGDPVAYLAIDPNNPNTMYAAAANHAGTSVGSFTKQPGGIWVTHDLQDGASSQWTKLPDPSGTEGHPYNVHVLGDGSPGHYGTLVVTYSGRIDTSNHFTASSGVFVGSWNGDGSFASWQDRSAPGMRYYTRDLVVDPHDSAQNTWYVATANDWGSIYPVPGNVAGAFYRTTDRGSTWTKILNMPVESATISPVNGDEMYVTTQSQGLWFTSNLSAATPTFTQVASYGFAWPERVFYNPYNPNEIWVASNGNGLSVGATNQAPTLNPASTATLAAIAQNAVSNPGSLVSDLIAGANPAPLITDADTGAFQGLAVTGVDETGGTWQFSLDAGASWSPLGTPGDTAARLLAADGNTRIRFVPAASFTGTATIRFRAWDRTYGAGGAVADVSFAGGSTAFSMATAAASITVNPGATLDADGNGTADALSDGILILRYLFDPAGAWNVNDALGAGAARTNRQDIKTFLDGGRTTALDPDGNGTADALSDGILILRYLFDPAGAWNVSDALGNGATRTTREDIKTYLDQYKPSPPPAPRSDGNLAADAGLAAAVAPAVLLAGAGDKAFQTAGNAGAASDGRGDLPCGQTICAADPPARDGVRERWSATGAVINAIASVGSPEEDAATLDELYGQDDLDWLLPRPGRLMPLP